MDNLRSILLSKTNVSQLYQTFMVSNKLMNADISKKTQITNQLVGSMNALYVKIDKSKITSNNLPSLISKFNELVLKKMNEVQRQPQVMQNRLPNSQELPERGLYDKMDTNKDKISPQERLQQLQASRDRDIPDMRKQRPPTPDFSLDGYGKSKPPQQQQQPQYQQQRQPQQPQQRQQQQEQLIDEDFMAFNGIDQNDNIDVYDTGISMDNFEEDNTPLDQRLRMLEQERNNIAKPPPPSNGNTTMSTPINKQPQREQREQREQKEVQRQPINKPINKPSQVQAVQQKYRQPIQDEPNEDLVPLSEVESILAEQKAYYEGELVKISKVTKQTPEVGKLRMENEMLKKELERISEEGNIISEEQEHNLQVKKQEVIAELEKLREKHEEIDNILHKNIEIEKRLDKKRIILQNTMDKYDTIDYIEVLDSSNEKYDDITSQYTYELNNIYEDVTGIEIEGFTLTTPFNITNENNTISCNDSIITVPYGNYTITSLINCINTINKMFKLEIEESTDYIKLISDQAVDISGTILGVLGLESNNNKQTVHIGSKQYYLPREQLIQVFINSIHVSTLQLNNGKVYNYNNMPTLDDNIVITFKTGTNKDILHYINHRLELKIKTRKDLTI